MAVLGHLPVAASLLSIDYGDTAMKTNLSTENLKQVAKAFPLCKVRIHEHDDNLTVVSFPRTDFSFEAPTDRHPDRVITRKAVPVLVIEDGKNVVPDLELRGETVWGDAKGHRLGTKMLETNVRRMFKELHVDGRKEMLRFLGALKRAH